jgi:hypothetical protein
VLYDRPVRELLVDAVGDMPDVFRRAEVVEWFRKQYPAVKPNTVTTLITAATVNSASRHYYPGLAQHLIFQRDDGRLERYDPPRHGQWTANGNFVPETTVNTAGPPASSAPARSDEPLAPSEGAFEAYGLGRAFGAYAPSLVTAVDIDKNLRTYLSDRKRTSRYASFDYCFNYFQSHREDGRLNELSEGQALQLSCLHLGFYLASWGRLRGSSELLQRSLRAYVPVVESLISAPADLWNLDVDGYSEPASNLLLSFAGDLRATLHDGASDILVTKIMLGTMGCVPAFDTNFKAGFGVSTFGRKALQKVGQFYRDNADVIEGHRERTFDFDTGALTERRYTRAKVIDMIFFIEGMRFATTGSVTFLPGQNPMIEHP